MLEIALLNSQHKPRRAPLQSRDIEFMVGNPQGSMFGTVQAAIGNPSRHMLEEQLGSVLLRCPICNADEIESRLELQFKPDVSLLRCRGCAAGFVSRMPTAEALREYYASYYDMAKYRDLGESHVHFSMPQRLGRHILRQVKLQPRSAVQRLFDFGGGDGTIAIFVGQQILAAGYAKQVDITVVDYAAPRPVHDARLSISGVREAASLEENDFDIGIASASLEHVPDLRGCLSRLLKAVRAGGNLYVRVPYVEPVIRLARSFGLNIDFCYPAHLYDLGETFWRRILATMGLTGCYAIRSSRPSIVESTLGSAPVRTIAAYTLKAPWWLLGERYGLVGGWEAVIERNQQL